MECLRLTGRCCNLDPGPPLPTFGVPAFIQAYFSNDACRGSPVPAMTPPADADSPTCLSIVPTGGTQPYSGMPCTPDVDPPPFLRACTPADPPGAEECFTDPPNIPGTCTTYYNHQWRCNYTHTVYNYNYTCPVGTDTAQMCRRTPNPATCSGAGGSSDANGQRALRLRQLDACSLPRVRRPGGKDVGRHPRDGQLPDDHGRPLVWLERHHSSAERSEPCRMRLESTTSLTRLPVCRPRRAPDRTARPRRSMLSADIATLHKRRRTTPTGSRITAAVFLRQSA